MPLLLERHPCQWYSRSCISVLRLQPCCPSETPTTSPKNLSHLPDIMTCATFELLDFLHKIAHMTKSSTFDLYRALEKVTDNTGVYVPKLKYRALSCMFLQWRHLKLLKWAERAHDPAGP